jgi:AraC-like DNA-binding protein
VSIRGTHAISSHTALIASGSLRSMAFARVRCPAQDRSHLFRRTRDVLGVSPSDLIRQARLQQGATLLTGSSDTVAEIAYAVGFNSVSYFSRAFQAEYGVTPTAFRTRELRS